MILSAVYQAFFVALMYAANRIGPRVGIVAMLLALLWTGTHLFFPPLMLVQATVILMSWWLFGAASEPLRAPKLSNYHAPTMTSVGSKTH